MNNTQNEKDLQAKINELEKSLKEVKQSLDILSTAISTLYEDRQPEKNIQAMGDIGRKNLNAAECEVYSIDPFSTGKVYTIDDKQRRYYVSAKDSLIQSAITDNRVIIDNSFSGDNVGDGKNNQGVQSIMVVPILSSDGDVIGATVAKDKDKGRGAFNEEDAKLFDLKEGKLGSLFGLNIVKNALFLKATTDELTRLSNREGMNHFLSSAVLSRIKSRDPVTAVIFDIDHFKSFNDTYGHDIGDKCLCQVAQTLKNNMRFTPDSGIFRWGGEEMVIILPTNEEKAFEIAERLRHAVEETPFIVDKQTGKSVQITVSAGLASFNPHDVYELSKDNIREAFDKMCFKKADNALYNAKENGRNRVYGSDEFMQTHYSMPSPTVMFYDFLQNSHLELVSNHNSYELYDKLLRKTIGRDIKTPEQVVDTLESIIDTKIILPLKNGLSSYCHLSVDGDGSIDDWRMFFEDILTDTEHDTHKQDFRREYAKELVMIDILTNKINEIKLDRIATPAQKEHFKEMNEKTKGEVLL